MIYFRPIGGGYYAVLVGWGRTDTRSVPTCGRSVRVGAGRGATNEIQFSKAVGQVKYDRIFVLLMKGWQILKPNLCSHIKTEIFTAEKRFFATRCCKFAHTDITVARIVYITN